MKLISFIDKSDQECLGIFFEGKKYDAYETANKHSLPCPKTMGTLLQDSEKNMEQLSAVFEKIKSGQGLEAHVRKTLSPVPQPTSCRDAYAFRQHVSTMRMNRGAEMTPEFDQFPVFYFTNHNAICILHTSW